MGKVIDGIAWFEKSKRNCVIYTDCVMDSRCWNQQRSNQQRKRETCFFYPFKLSYHALNVCSSRNLYEQKRVKHLITVRERYAPTRITPSIRLLVKGIVYFTAPYSIATLIIVVAFNTTHSKYLTHVIGLSLAPWFTLLLARWKNSISPLDSRNINHIAANLKNWIDD